MTTSLRVGLSLTILVALLLPANNVAAQHCSAKTTAGRYVVVCNGYLSPGPNAPLVPAKTLATATADENGTFTGVGTILASAGRS